MEDILKQFEALNLAKSKKFIKETRYQVGNSTVSSYRMPDFAFKGSLLPIKARGLFITQETLGVKIVVRGYDKFFNLGEVTETSWKWIQKNTVAPYEFTVKENGCIIFLSVLNDQLFVASKHSLSSPHAAKANEWLDVHLSIVQKTRDELVLRLKELDCTAVFELADDDFEEHVLEYTKEKRGLYLHGLNKNQVVLDTLPMNAVSEFGLEFGFYVVDHFYKQSFEELQEYATEVSKSGCYKGQPIEGFVVRCKKLDSSIHLFKIKFDDPYLMFREWRQVTKSLLSKPDVLPRYRYELTARYIVWVRGMMLRNRDLFAEYQNNKGIILVRNLFLSNELGLDTFANIDLTEFCKTNGMSSDSDGEEKVLLVPVATIGVGKTTLCRTICNLHPDIFGHIQNDNITDKKNGAHAFESTVLQEFQHHDYVFADRNNHLSFLRKGIISAFKSVYPKGKVYLLDWQIDKLDKKLVFDTTYARVLSRGENHQSLTPNVKDVKRILNGFIYNRHPVDLNSENDADVDELIVMDFNGDVQSNVSLVLGTLGFDKVEVEDLDDAISDALQFKETVKKVVKGSKPIKASYYGIKVDLDVRDLLQKQSGLTGDFRWGELISLIGDRFIPDLHCTITHRAQKSKDSIVVLEFYDGKNNGKVSQPIQPLETQIVLGASRIVWNDRIAVLPIDTWTPDFFCSNQHRHITISLLKEDAKSRESNSLLEAIHNGSSKYSELRFHSPIQIKGVVSAFYN